MATAGADCEAQSECGGELLQSELEGREGAGHDDPHSQGAGGGGAVGAAEGPGCWACVGGRASWVSS